MNADVLRAIAELKTQMVWYMLAFSVSQVAPIVGFRHADFTSSWTTPHGPTGHGATHHDTLANAEDAGPSMQRIFRCGAIVARKMGTVVGSIAVAHWGIKKMKTKWGIRFGVGRGRA
jgi:hypothetical protein